MSQKQSTDPTAAVDVEPISKFAEDIAGSTERSRVDAHRLQGEINVALEDWAAQPRALRLVVILILREHVDRHDACYRAHTERLAAELLTATERAATSTMQRHHADRARSLREAARLLEAIEDAL